jgi:hypothetical protein
VARLEMREMGLGRVQGARKRRDQRAKATEAKCGDARTSITQVPPSRKRNASSRRCTRDRPARMRARACEAGVLVCVVCPKQSRFCGGSLRENVYCCIESLLLMCKFTVIERANRKKIGVYCVCDSQSVCFLCCN